MKMLRGMDPRKRFLLMLVVVYALSLPVISAITYVILRDFALREAYRTGELYLSAMEEIRNYVGDELRPVMYEELPGRFIVEAMSRSYISGHIARMVNQKYPGYRYKNATIASPKNPIHAADAFEAEIIESFVRAPEAGEWKGILDTPGGMHVVIARKGEPFTGDCLRCHGDPRDAPPELTARYGKKAGFGMEEGRLADGKFVYIPIESALAEAKKNASLFIVLYTVFFGVIFLIINHRFRGLFATIESDSRKIEAINTDLTELNQELETMVAERTMSLLALTVADRVRNPAAIIGWMSKRLLREEEGVSGKLRESLVDIAEEAEKLEAIVKEFETVSTGRKSVFRHEDINGVLNMILPLISREAEEKGVVLGVALSGRPLRINTQRNLLKAAVLHTVRNAIEATPPGGRVTLATSEEEGNAVITVSDTGTGIPEEDLDRIFEPYFSTKEQRFGIGLPLVRQIVSEHLGRIEVKSKPGEGTTMRLILPRRWTGETATAP